jgi:hypothetical protein
MERVEMGLEMGRNCAAQNIFAGPMSVAKVLQRSVEMVQISRENVFGGSYSG